MNKKMTKIAYMVVLVVLLLSVVTNIAFGARIRSVTPELNGKRRAGWPTVFEWQFDIGPGDYLEIEVEVEGKNEEVYLGATVYLKNYNDRWQDFPAKRIEFAGRRRKEVVTISIDVDKEYLGRRESGVALVVALWEEKVYCDDPDDPWCRRNGYRLEEQIESTGPADIGVYWPGY